MSDRPLTKQLFDEIAKYEAPDQKIFEGGDSEDGDRRFRVWKRDHDDYRKIVNAVGSIIDAMNGTDEKLVQTALIHGLIDAHRYLEEKAIVTLFQALGRLGLLATENPNQFSDARNAFAMKLCAKLPEAYKDELFWRA